MTKAKLGILTIHGMGEPDKDPETEFDDALQEGLDNRLSFWSDIYVQRIDYHKVIGGIDARSPNYHKETNQERVWSSLSKEWDQEYPKPIRDLRRFFRFGISSLLRKFFLYSFGDAVTYQWQQNKHNSVYYKVHEEIKFSMDKLYKNLAPGSPVVIIAQSLGCHVISNYIYDAQKSLGIWEGKKPDPFHKFESLKLIMTTGCNIPLFVSGFEDILAFEKPNTEFKWYNFYDRDDILGWPIKQLTSEETKARQPEDSNAYYDAVVTKDIEIKTGLNPVSAHTRYWKDRGFLDPAAEFIKNLYMQQLK